MSPEDQIVNLLSRWLARHVGNDDLARALDEIGRDRLAPEHAEAVEELRTELERAGASSRGSLEVAVRETLEVLAFG